MLQRWGIMFQVVGALCFKWWMRMWEVGHYAAEVGHYVSSGGGIMLQVVDANAGGGALC